VAERKPLFSQNPNIELRIVYFLMSSVLLYFYTSFLIFNSSFSIAPLLGFLAGHKRPADGLGIFEDAGLDGLMFEGDGHRFILLG